MKQIKIRDKEYNCSNKVYYHIQGLESENRVISMELLGHENNELQQQKEIERLNNIINKIDKLFDVDTHCENIYHAIGVLLKKPYFEIEMMDNEEILNILGVDKE